MLAAFGRYNEMERDGDGGSLLAAEPDESKNDAEALSATSLAATAQTALKDQKVREMLAAFRAEGPSALARYVDDPECSRALEILRGSAKALPPPAASQLQKLSLVPEEPVVEGTVVEGTVLNNPISNPRVLLGCTGSVATVKAPRLAAELAAFAEVKVILTARGRAFWDRARAYDEAGWAAFSGCGVEVLGADDDWKGWNEIGDPVVHVDLRKWADLLIVAPLGANSLAKLSAGLCDDLLSCVARAWDFSKGFVVAPAMNTAMWRHPLTAGQLRGLEGFGVRVVPPVSKELACGDVGPGALAELRDILEVAQDELGIGPGGKAQ